MLENCLLCLGCINHQRSRLGALDGTKDDFLLTISSFSRQIPQVRRVVCHYLSNSDTISTGPAKRNKGLGFFPKVSNFVHSTLPALAIPYQLSSSCKSHSPGSEAPAQSPPAGPANNCSSSDIVFEGNVPLV